LMQNAKPLVFMPAVLMFGEFFGCVSGSCGLMQKSP